MRKRVYFFLYFVFLLILLYAVLDFRTSRNTGAEVDMERKAVHVTLFVILMVLGMYYTVTTAGGRIVKSPVKSALWLIIGWIAVVNLLQNASMWIVAVHLGLSVLWILAYHFFSYYLRYFPNAWSQMQVCIMIMFGFYVFSALYAAYIFQMIYDRIIVVNLAYGVLVFLPWILLMARKRMRHLGILIVFFVVLVSMKRGAIIVFPLMLGTSMLVEAIIRKKWLGRVTLKAIFWTTLFFAGLLIVNQWSKGFLTERFLPAQLAIGSGRAEFYRASIEEISQRSQWYLLIGYGSGSTEDYLGYVAHNEWLEFLFNFGIIGVVFYALLFLVLIRRVRQLIRKSSPYASAYAMAVAYMLIIGMVGQIYFAHSTFYIMAFLGAVEGLILNDARNPQVLSADYVQHRQQGTMK